MPDRAHEKEKRKRIPPEHSVQEVALINLSLFADGIWSETTDYLREACQRAWVQFHRVAEAAKRTSVLDLLAEIRLESKKTVLDTIPFSHLAKYGKYEYDSCSEDSFVPDVTISSLQKSGDFLHHQKFYDPTDSSSNLDRDFPFDYYSDSNDAYEATFLEHGYSKQLEYTEGYRQDPTMGKAEEPPIGNFSRLCGPFDPIKFNGLVREILKTPCDLPLSRKKEKALSSSSAIWRDNCVSWTNWLLCIYPEFLESLRSREDISKIIPPDVEMFVDYLEILEKPVTHLDLEQIPKPKLSSTARCKQGIRRLYKRISSQSVRNLWVSTASDPLATCFSQREVQQDKGGSLNFTVSKDSVSSFLDLEVSLLPKSSISVKEKSPDLSVPSNTKDKASDNTAYKKDTKQEPTSHTTSKKEIPLSAVPNNIDLPKMMASSQAKAKENHHAAPTVCKLTPEEFPTLSEAATMNFKQPATKKVLKLTPVEKLKRGPSLDRTSTEIQFHNGQLQRSVHSKSDTDLHRASTQSSKPNSVLSTDSSGLRSESDTEVQMMDSFKRQENDIVRILHSTTSFISSSSDDLSPVSYQHSAENGRMNINAPTFQPRFSPQEHPLFAYAQSFQQPQLPLHFQVPRLPPRYQQPNNIENWLRNPAQAATQIPGPRQFAWQPSPQLPSVPPGIRRPPPGFTHPQQQHMQQLYHNPQFRPPYPGPTGKPLNHQQIMLDPNLQNQQLQLGHPQSMLQNPQIPVTNPQSQNIPHPCTTNNLLPSPFFSQTYTSTQDILPYLGPQQQQPSLQQQMAVTATTIPLNFGHHPPASNVTHTGTKGVNAPGANDLPSQTEYQQQHHPHHPQTESSKGINGNAGLLTLPDNAAYVMNMRQLAYAFGFSSQIMPSYNCVVPPPVRMPGPQQFVNTSNPLFQQSGAYNSTPPFPPISSDPSYGYWPRVPPPPQSQLINGLPNFQGSNTNRINNIPYCYAATAAQFTFQGYSGVYPTPNYNQHDQQSQQFKKDGAWDSLKSQTYWKNIPTNQRSANDPTKQNFGSENKSDDRCSDASSEVTLQGGEPSTFPIDSITGKDQERNNVGSGSGKSRRKRDPTNLVQIVGGGEQSRVKKDRTRSKISSSHQDQITSSTFGQKEKMNSQSLQKDASNVHSASETQSGDSDRSATHDSSDGEWTAGGDSEENAEITQVLLEEFASVLSENSAREPTADTSEDQLTEICSDKPEEKFSSGHSQQKRNLNTSGSSRSSDAEDGSSVSSARSQQPYFGRMRSTDNKVKSHHKKSRIHYTYKGGPHSNRRKLGQYTESTKHGSSSPIYQGEGKKPMGTSQSIFLLPQQIPLSMQNTGQQGLLNLQCPLTPDIGMNPNEQNLGDLYNFQSNTCPGSGNVSPVVLVAISSASPTSSSASSPRPLQIQQRTGSVTAPGLISPIVLMGAPQESLLSAPLTPTDISDNSSLIQHLVKWNVAQMADDHVDAADGSQFRWIPEDDLERQAAEEYCPSKDSREKLAYTTLNSPPHRDVGRCSSQEEATPRHSSNVHTSQHLSKAHIYPQKSETAAKTENSSSLFSTSSNIGENSIQMKKLHPDSLNFMPNQYENKNLENSNKSFAYEVSKDSPRSNQSYEGPCILPGKYPFKTNNKLNTEKLFTRKGRSPLSKQPKLKRPFNTETEKERMFQNKIDKQKSGNIKSPFNDLLGNRMSFHNSRSFKTDPRMCAASPGSLHLKDANQMKLLQALASHLLTDHRNPDQRICQGIDESADTSGQKRPVRISTPHEIKNKYKTLKASPKSIGLCTDTRKSPALIPMQFASYRMANNRNDRKTEDMVNPKIHTRDPSTNYRREASTSVKILQSGNPRPLFVKNPPVIVSNKIHDMTTHWSMPLNTRSPPAFGRGNFQAQKPFNNNPSPLTESETSTMSNQPKFNPLHHPTRNAKPEDRHRKPTMRKTMHLSGSN